MNAREAAQKVGMPGTGFAGELVEDAIDTTQRTMKGAHGVQPAHVLNIEQVSVLGGGHQVMVSLQTPEGVRAYVLQAADADGAGVRLRECAASAGRGLFVVGNPT